MTGSKSRFMGLPPQLVRMPEGACCYEPNVITARCGRGFIQVRDPLTCCDCNLLIYQMFVLWQARETVVFESQ